MGTSSPSSGSSSHSPLVPTWLEDPVATPIPGDHDIDPPGDSHGVENGQQQSRDDEDSSPRQPILPPPERARFRTARSNFSRFARSGGYDRNSLRRSVRDYIRDGTGGARRAVQRMGQARKGARAALGILRSFQQGGAEKALRWLGLTSLEGQSARDVLIGLTEIICEDGATIDSATARVAWIETVAELDQLDIDDLDALTSDQVRMLFLTYIAHTIQERLYQEIAVGGTKLAISLDDMQRIDRQFKDYIERTVHDSFTEDLSELSTMTDNEIARVVDQTYLDAWELLARMGTGK